MAAPGATLTSTRAAEHRRGIKSIDVVFYAVMSVLALIFMFPFIWTVSSSLKAPGWRVGLACT